MPWVRRITATLLVLGAASGLAAGCGGSSASGDGGALGASAPITRAQAIAYAHAVNLRAADIPEMSTSSPEGVAPTPRHPTFARCYGGVSPARRVLKIHSPEFAAGRGAQSQTEASEVEVWPTPSLAARNIAANHTSRYRACFLRFQEGANKNLNKGRAGQLLYGPLTVSSLPDLLPGVDGSYGLRITQSLLRGGQVHLHIYHDVFGFLSGPAEIELTATGLSKPVPLATEKRLLSLLYSRAQAHAL